MENQEPILPEGALEGASPTGYLHDPERAMASMLKRNQGTKASFGRVTVGLFFDEKVLIFRPNEMRLLREISPYVSVEDAAKKAKLTR